MTDKEIIKRLRGWARDIQEGSTAIWAMDQDLKEAANRIEELVKERDDWKAASQGGFRAILAILKRVQAAEARATRLEAERDAAWKRAEHAENMWGSTEVTLTEAINILEDALQEAGDDYPGSTMQRWCQQQIKQARKVRGK